MPQTNKNELEKDKKHLGGKIHKLLNQTLFRKLTRDEYAQLVLLIAGVFDLSRHDKERTAEVVEEIYIVECLEDVGWIEDVAYFRNLPDALKDLKQRVAARKKECREDDSLAKGEDVPDGESNGKVEPAVYSHNKNVLYSASIYFWRKCSYEYDEWDVESETWRIRKVALTTLRSPEGEEGKG